MRHSWVSKKWDKLKGIYLKYKVQKYHKIQQKIFEKTFLIP